MLKGFLTGLCLGALAGLVVTIPLTAVIRRSPRGGISRCGHQT